MSFRNHFNRRRGGAEGKAIIGAFQEFGASTFVHGCTSDMSSLEVPMSRNRRLDAALWTRKEEKVPLTRRMDIALEWEWDQGKASQYLNGDFRKLLKVNAETGLAVVATRADGRRGPTRADETVIKLRRACHECRTDCRPVGLIEIQRTIHTSDQVAFVCYYHDFAAPLGREILRWSYSGDE